MARKRPKNVALGCFTVLAAGAAISFATNLVTRRSGWDWRVAKLAESRVIATVTVNGRTVEIRRLLETAWNEGGEPKDNDTFDNLSLDNKASFIYVDQDGDSRLQPLEGRPSNLPLRIDDAMFDVNHRGDEQVRLTPSKEPLQGIVRGRACPPFAYTDTSGKQIALKSLTGKVTVVQVWSAACEPCVRHLSQMAAWKRKYGDRVNLLSLSVDRSYDGDAKAVVAKAMHQEGVSWPVVVEPTGWNGLARRFNLFHFGFFVVDAAGNVAEANQTAHAVEEILSRTLP